MIGHMVANSANRHLDTALNPAWRDTISHFVVGTGWPDTLPADAAQQIRSYVTFNATAALRKLAPDSGAYFNEVLWRDLGPFPTLQCKELSKLMCCF